MMDAVMSLQVRYRIQSDDASRITAYFATRECELEEVLLSYHIYRYTRGRVWNRAVSLSICSLACYEQQRKCDR